VAEGVSLGCRLYVAAPQEPSILFFHGNGEIAADYDDIAPLYRRLGANLFVADYRGYGTSTGSPSFATMMADAHAVFRFFQELLAAQDFGGARYVMGRSLGAHSAVELAAHYPQALAGLIVESGTAGIGRMAERLAQAGRPQAAAELEARHLEKLRAIALPTLLIHGEWDELVPVERAWDLYETLTVERKRLVTIPQAGHNDLFFRGLQQYMAAVQAFVSSRS
jgi:hypothetical protein